MFLDKTFRIILSLSTPRTLSLLCSWTRHLHHTVSFYTKKSNLNVLCSWSRHFASYCFSLHLEAQVCYCSWTRHFASYYLSLHLGVKACYVLEQDVCIILFLSTPRSLNLLFLEKTFRTILCLSIQVYKSL